jgi:hemolysin activation/secretion protein
MAKTSLIPGLLVAVGAFCGPVRAQQAPSTGFDVRQTEKRFDQWQAEQTRPRGGVGVPRLSSAAAPASHRPLFVLRAVEVTGATTVAAADLAGIYQPYLGKKVLAADLTAISVAISDLYRARGYHLSRAVIPPQDAPGGRLRIQVIEGRIADVVIRGENVARFGLAELLAPVTAEAPSRLATLERQLLLANQRPGVQVRDTALEEIGTGSGRFRLVVTAQTWSAFTSFGLDNLGSRAVGPWQSYATAAYNSMLAPGDTLAVNLSTVPNNPSELAFSRLSYDVPVGTEGFKLGATALYSAVQPGDFRREFHDRTITQAAEIRAGFVPIQSQAATLALTVSAGFADVNEADSYGPIYQDHIRTLGLAADYRLRDDFGGTSYLSLSWRQGMDVFGASRPNDPDVSRVGAAPTFSAVTGWVSRVQTFNDAWSAKVSAAGQWASGPLYTSQQFYLGGASFGRGYGSAEISGDNALAGSAELRFDQSVPNTPWMRGFQIYAFAETGAVWNVGYKLTEGLSLTSAGGGVRFFLADNLTLDLGAAVPLTFRAPDNVDRHPRLLLTLSNSLRLCPERPGLKCL